MDSRKYSMYSFFRFWKMLLFYVCFFYRFRKMFFEAEIIDSIFYVSCPCYIYICIYIYTYIYMYIYIYIIYSWIVVLHFSADYWERYNGRFSRNLFSLVLAASLQRTLWMLSLQMRSSLMPSLASCVLTGIWSSILMTWYIYIHTLYLLNMKQYILNTL